MPKLRIYMLAACVSATPGVAIADMVTESFTFPTVTRYVTESGTDISLVNSGIFKFKKHVDNPGQTPMKPQRRRPANHPRRSPDGETGAD
jgi:hypothetical protein